MTGKPELYLRTDVTPEEVFIAIGKLRMEARREIDRLIKFLDRTDDYVSRELEDDDDREPDEGGEPSLGSFDRMIDQTKSWRKAERDTDVYYGWSGGVDLEQDDADYEDADPDEAKQQPPEMGGAA